MKKGLSDQPKRFQAKQPRPQNTHIRAASKPGAKRAVNLSINAEILASAKALRINISQVLEDELRKRTQEARVAKWQEENREAFESYNRFIAEHGIWSKKYRQW